MQRTFHTPNDSPPTISMPFHSCWCFKYLCLLCAVPSRDSGIEPQQTLVECIELRLSFSPFMESVVCVFLYILTLLSAFAL